LFFKESIIIEPFGSLAELELKILINYLSLNILILIEKMKCKLCSKSIENGDYKEFCSQECYNEFTILKSKNFNLTGRHMVEVAQKIIPIFTWDDIVISQDIRLQLKAICHHVTYKSKVNEKQGVDRELSRGVGPLVLFSGPSGTGKTMAAEVIANELELDLYRIDLSSVVNKYIGETEKNLKKVFDETEKSNAILFFDEADALFGKRSEIKDSHDRYSNIEINYLLQKIEEYKGLCILATNMRKALDSAFLCRIKFAIDFQMPDADQRRVIWQKCFEPKAPNNSVNFEFLAKQFKISGGNIRNVTLNATFLAATDNTEVEMKHIVRAIKREYIKIGKPCLESEFGSYFPMVK